jgi:hypothetical protein
MKNKDTQLKEMICQACEFYVNAELCTRVGYKNVTERLKTETNPEVREIFIEGTLSHSPYCSWNKTIFEIYKEIKEDENSKSI